MATPQVPPRPARSNQVAANEAETTSQTPAIPPRPTVGRRRDRSLSPERDRYAPSPLNAAPFMPKPSSESNNPYSNAGAKVSGSNLDLHQRPPSVNLPSIGQEGNEYENHQEHEAEPLSRTISATSATQTTHVGNDLPLHAPKPGLSQSEARARVQGVTHSDNFVSSSPAGRRPSAQFDDKDPNDRSLRSRSSLQLRSPSVASNEGPGSIQAEENGIPKIGIQVPMHRHAGDVQAPSPAPQQLSISNDTRSRSRHHNRTRSGRDQSNPPDSYGRHGHGVTFNDKFKKDWYAKHPEVHAQDGHYSHVLHGVQRHYVMSSEDLNKLVQETAKTGSGFGRPANLV